MLELDSKALVEAYVDSVWLCPMNSGCTKPFPHPRGSWTFQRISNYPYSHWKTKRNRGERVVEVAVDYAVPDVSKFVKRVVRMMSADELALVFEA